MSVEIQQSLEQLPFHPGVSIIKTHPSGIIALNKPTAVMSHPNKAGDERRSLLTCKWDAQRECFSRKARDGRTHRFFLLHRLDSATSGVILGCTSPQLAAELKKQFSERNVSKTYYAVVAGAPRQRRELWKDQLVRQRSGSKVRVKSVQRGGQKAETSMHLVKSAGKHPGFSLLELAPHTGRTHQLRVQCAERSLPILGDTTYGDFELNKGLKKLGANRLFLHAASIRIDGRLQGKAQKFEASCPVPGEFDDILKKST